MAAVPAKALAQAALTHTILVVLIRRAALGDAMAIALSECAACRAERSRSHGSWLRCWRCGDADASGAGAGCPDENALAAAVLLGQAEPQCWLALAGCAAAPGNVRRVVPGPCNALGFLSSQSSSAFASRKASRVESVGFSWSRATIVCCKRSSGPPSTNRCPAGGCRRMGGY